jgi:hypothetical protein
VSLDNIHKLHVEINLPVIGRSRRTGKIADA